MLLQLQHLPPSLHPAYRLPIFTPIVHVHGSYLQVVRLPHFLHYSYPPPVYFPPIIYATYSLYLSPHSLPLTPLLITLHVISISVVLFLFQLLAQFAFVFVLGVVVNNCEFAVIFTVHIFYLLFFQINPFNISYNKGLVMMNSFTLTLSEKHFICPSILNDSFAGYSILGCRSLPFMTLNTSCL